MNGPRPFNAGQRSLDPDEVHTHLGRRLPRECVEGGEAGNDNGSFDMLTRHRSSLQTKRSVLKRRREIVTRVYAWSRRRGSRQAPSGMLEIPCLGPPGGGMLF